MTDHTPVRERANSDYYIVESVAIRGNKRGAKSMFDVCGGYTSIAIYDIRKA
jgi:hypothetical protein